MPSDASAHNIAQGLKALTPAILAQHLQVSEQNPMAGLEGRSNLLIQLGTALEKRPDICATGRPGDMLGESSPIDLRHITHPRLLPNPPAIWLQIPPTYAVVVDAV